ncbi:hypothetical protein METBIDRAFT_96030 [Metschnikowia bicuspidata var. bicuspidata NRRL YB-4993]|uniref:Uncharacterized protein n=1 Tax=Metschnikowia bicuspidata var. bicuspidata NRRL YB-4993 TaxID=869754 RepID=A0A1A0HG57_9ASCO|nr:hypothetical protein METBIDRAFT_96030 [Metschnikowia bicuspidata var. bicuspidata NRRL YB-4993]OBA22986.1 hypothetical protein METBIDRAFT_96030 [Metschnikowia bicuspidata var. bicuspidata NRRL YB-4993]
MPAEGNGRATSYLIYNVIVELKEIYRVGSRYADVCGSDIYLFSFWNFSFYAPMDIKKSKLKLDFYLDKIRNKECPDILDWGQNLNKEYVAHCTTRGYPNYHSFVSNQGEQECRDFTEHRIMYYLITRLVKKIEGYPEICTKNSKRNPRFVDSKGESKRPRKVWNKNLKGDSRLK